MTKLYDNHNHSEFSFDGKRTSVLASAISAKEKGLGGLCFTDHCDFFVPMEKAEHENRVPEVFDIAAQQAEIDKVRSIIPEISIMKGIELGMYHDCHQQIRNVLKAGAFDQVTASVHYIENSDPYWGNYYIGKDFKQAYGHYLETIYNEITWLEDFDVLGHFDYVTRYAPYPETSILYSDFGDILDCILRYIAEEGKALEINTKTYQDYNGRTPILDENILKRYLELGGEIISLGSDSHDDFNVGYNITKWPEYLKSLGFKYLAHFEKRRLIML